MPSTLEKAWRERTFATVILYVMIVLVFLFVIGSSTCNAASVSSRNLVTQRKVAAGLAPHYWFEAKGISGHCLWRDYARDVLRICPLGPVVDYGPINRLFSEISNCESQNAETVGNLREPIKAAFDSIYGNFRICMEDAAKRDNRAILLNFNAIHYFYGERLYEEFVDRMNAVIAENVRIHALSGSKNQQWNPPEGFPSTACVASCTSIIGSTSGCDCGIVTPSLVTRVGSPPSFLPNFLRVVAADFAEVDATYDVSRHAIGLFFFVCLIIHCYRGASALLGIVTGLIFFAGVYLCMESRTANFDMLTDLATVCYMGSYFKYGFRSGQRNGNFYITETAASLPILTTVSIEVGIIITHLYDFEDLPIWSSFMLLVVLSLIYFYFAFTHPDVKGHMKFNCLVCFLRMLRAMPLVTQRISLFQSKVGYGTMVLIKYILTVLFKTYHSSTPFLYKRVILLFDSYEWHFDACNKSLLFWQLAACILGYIAILLLHTLYVYFNITPTVTHRFPNRQTDVWQMVLWIPDMALASARRALKDHFQFIMGASRKGPSLNAPFAFVFMITLQSALELSLVYLLIGVYTAFKYRGKATFGKTIVEQNLVIDGFDQIDEPLPSTITHASKYLGRCTGGVQNGLAYIYCGNLYSVHSQIAAMPHDANHAIFDDVSYRMKETTRLVNCSELAVANALVTTVLVHEGLNDDVTFSQYALASSIKSRELFGDSTDVPEIKRGGGAKDGTFAILTEDVIYLRRLTGCTPLSLSQGLTAHDTIVAHTFIEKIGKSATISGAPVFWRAAKLGSPLYYYGHVVLTSTGEPIIVPFYDGDTVDLYIPDVALVETVDESDREQPSVETTSVRPEHKYEDEHEYNYVPDSTEGRKRKALRVIRATFLAQFLNTTVNATMTTPWTPATVFLVMQLCKVLGAGRSEIIYVEELLYSSNAKRGFFVVQHDVVRHLPSTMDKYMAALDRAFPRLPLPAYYKSAYHLYSASAFRKLLRLRGQEVQISNNADELLDEVTSGPRAPVRGDYRRVPPPSVLSSPAPSTNATLRRTRFSVPFVSETSDTDADAAPDAMASDAPTDDAADSPTKARASSTSPVRDVAESDNSQIDRLIAQQYVATCAAFTVKDLEAPAPHFVVRDPDHGYFVSDNILRFQICELALRYSGTVPPGPPKKSASNVTWRGTQPGNPPWSAGGTTSNLDITFYGVKRPDAEVNRYTESKFLKGYLSSREYGAVMDVRRITSARSYSLPTAVPNARVSPNISAKRQIEPSQQFMNFTGKTTVLTEPLNELDLKIPADGSAAGNVMQVRSSPPADVMSPAPVQQQKQLEEIASNASGLRATSVTFVPRTTDPAGITSASRASKVPFLSESQLGSPFDTSASLVMPGSVSHSAPGPGSRSSLPPPGRYSTQEFTVGAAIPGPSPAFQEIPPSAAASLQDVAGDGIRHRHVASRASNGE